MGKVATLGDFRIKYMSQSWTLHLLITTSWYLKTQHFLRWSSVFVHHRGFSPCLYLPFFCIKGDLFCSHSGMCPPEAVSRCNAVQRRVSRSWRREPAILPSKGGGGGGDFRQHGCHQRPTTPLQTWRPCLHPPWLQQGNTHTMNTQHVRTPVDVLWILS